MSITITFGDVAENHVRMQQIGTMASEGFTVSDLTDAKIYFDTLGAETHLYDLENLGGLGNLENLGNVGDIKGSEAAVLVVRTSLKYLSCDPDSLFKELSALTWDSKMKAYGRVVNKHARHNLCFSDQHQDADLENGKGTVVGWEEVPILSYIRSTLSSFLGNKGANLQAEGNYYFDTTKCGIGYHGDTERRKVVAIRLGQSIPLHYQWYHNSAPVGNNIAIELNHGDLYIMSEKAVGQDWKKRSILTLRHAAGCAKFTKGKEVKEDTQRAQRTQSSDLKGLITSEKRIGHLKSIAKQLGFRGYSKYTSKDIEVLRAGILSMVN